LRIQHQAKDQKDLATASEFVLFDRCRHGLASDDPGCTRQRPIADSYPCTIPT
jgi:hypothetical protein